MDKKTLYLVEIIEYDYYSDNKDKITYELVKTDDIEKIKIHFKYAGSLDIKEIIEL